MRRVLTSVFITVTVASCGSPTPATVNNGPPPPPPAPVVVEEKPPPEPPKPDPLEVALNEVSQIVKRYGGVFATVKDEATADKAVQEIGRMTARVRELTAEISKLPPRPGQEKFALQLQNDLTQLSTAQLSNPDMQRVLGDPDLGLKLIAAQQSFVTEGLLPLGNALVTSQSGGAARADQPAAAKPTPPMP